MLTLLGAPKYLYHTCSVVSTVHCEVQHIIHHECMFTLPTVAIFIGSVVPTVYCEATLFHKCSFTKPRYSIAPVFTGSAVHVVQCEVPLILLLCVCSPSPA